jgi:hypothetical protein
LALVVLLSPYPTHYHGGDTTTASKDDMHRDRDVVSKSEVIHDAHGKV